MNNIQKTITKIKSQYEDKSELIDELITDEILSNNPSLINISEIEKYILTDTTIISSHNDNFLLNQHRKNTDKLYQIQAIILKNTIKLLPTQFFRNHENVEYAYFANIKTQYNLLKNNVKLLNDITKLLFVLKFSLTDKQLCVQAAHLEVVTRVPAGKLREPINKGYVFFLK